MNIIKWFLSLYENKSTQSIVESEQSPCDSNALKVQVEKADAFYNKFPELAFRIAMGRENPPEGLLAAVIYAKVCGEVEKKRDIDKSTELANSEDNFKISAEAQRLKLRKPDNVVERLIEIKKAKMKRFENSLPKGKTYFDVKNEMVVTFPPKTRPEQGYDELC
jgi:hypothetical protein